MLKILHSFCISFIAGNSFLTASTYLVIWYTLTCICCSNNWWHVSGTASYNGRVLALSPFFKLATDAPWECVLCKVMVVLPCCNNSSIIQLWVDVLIFVCVACDPACCMLCLIPSTTEDVSCEFGSSKYYALCGFGGILSCGLTHTAVVPLDLVKCRLQVCMKAKPHYQQEASTSSSAVATCVPKQ